MITEKGTVKTSTHIDARVQKELNKNTLVFGIILIVFGSLFLVAWVGYVVIGILNGIDFDDWLLLLGAILLVIGILICRSCNKALLETRKYDTVQEVEFFKDYLIAREYVNGEHVGTLKTYYVRIVNVKETRNFIIIFNTRATAYAVDKATLSPAELNAVLALVRPIRGVTPAPAADGVQSNVQTPPATDESAAAENADDTDKAADNSTDQSGDGENNNQ